MTCSRILLCLGAAALLAAPEVPDARGATIDVVPGESIQAAIDAAGDGDEIALAAGTWHEDIDFAGKAIRVVGLGPETVLNGTGAGPVVTFAAGEGPASVLDSVTVTGGVADRGGGIFIQGASPTVLRNLVVRNQARFQGSAVYLGGSTAELRNNLIAHNTTAPGAGDPHSVQIVGGAPSVVNNTVVDGDSNGIIVGGGAVASRIVNNVIANNGSFKGGSRGRGICDFAIGTIIQFNVFAANRRGALLTSDGVNYSRIRTAQRRIGEARLADNLDASPRFESRRFDDYRLRPRSPAIDRGAPDAALADRDGTRNDVGYTGGPLAPDW